MPPSSLQVEKVGELVVLVTTTCKITTIHTIYRSLIEPKKLKKLMNNTAQVRVNTLPIIFTKMPCTNAFTRRKNMMII